MALPLIAAALVCLLATSGVWLFSGKGDKPKKKTEAIGLNVPTQVFEQPPDAESSAPASPSPVPSRSPAKSPAKSPSASKSPSPSPSKTTSRPPSSSAPPPAPPPPPQANPADITVRMFDGWNRTSTISIANRTNLPLNSWTLTITLPNGSTFTLFEVSYGDASAGYRSAVGSATGKDPLNPNEFVVISFDVDGRARGATCDINGAPCDLR
ncbi:MAG: hypothetical protein HOV68_05110 [Streptomycetaceae bacterium]|nr:hypothetical protein [Streptomycetaceae bacterium]